MEKTITIQITRPNKNFMDYWRTKYSDKILPMFCNGELVGGDEQDRAMFNLYK